MKRILVIILPVILGLIFNGETAICGQFVKSFGTNSTDEGHCVILTSDSCYLVTGYITGSPGAGNKDVFLAKFNVCGQQIWARTIGEADNEEGLCVIETHDGDYVLTGYTHSVGGSRNHLLIARFDSDGNKEWVKYLKRDQQGLHEALEFKGFSLIEDSDHNLVVAGQLYHASLTRYSQFLARFEPDGDLLSFRYTYNTAFTGRDHYGYSVVEMHGDSGYLVIGKVYGSSIKEEILLTRYRHNGSFDWGWYFRDSPNPDTECGYSIIKTNDGGYAITGITDNDLFVLKRDAEVNHVWAKLLNGSYEGRSIIQSIDGDLIVAGGMSDGTGDITVSKLDLSSGSAQWRKKFGGSEAQQATSILEDNYGDFILTGHSTSWEPNSKNAFLIKCDSDGFSCLQDYIGAVPNTWNPDEGGYPGMSGVVPLYIEVYDWANTIINAVTFAEELVCNNKPDTPDVIVSQFECSICGYYIKVSSEDPYGDSISYFFRWPDGSTTGWTEFVPNGNTYTVSRYYRPGYHWFWIKAKNSCNFESDSLLYSFTTTCPYVMVWDGSAFIEDNNILPKSEELGTEEDVLDYYKLQIKPEPKSGMYALRVSEFENEHTYADKFELAVIDHDEQINTAITETGNIYTYGKLLSPLQVSNGVNEEITAFTGMIDDDYKVINQNYTLTINFGKIQANSARIFVGMKSRVNGIYLAPSIYPGDTTSCNKMHKVNLKVFTEGDETSTLRPRENGTLAVSDISTLIPDADQDFMVKLYFPASHSIDYIGLDTSTQVDVEMKKLPLLKAVHSNDGDATDAILNNDDIYVEITPGEHIDLYFEDVSCQNSAKRDFVLISNGHYSRCNESYDLSDEMANKESVSNLTCTPNPFNPNTEVSFVLNKDCHVRVDVYNIIGQKIITLVDENKATGEHNILWDSRETDGSTLASGIYFFRIQADNQVISRKMVLMK